MADGKKLDVSVVFRAQDLLSPQLRKIQEGVRRLDASLKGGALKNYAAHLAVIGTAASGAAAALGFAVKGNVDQAASLQTVMTHVRNSMSGGAQTAAHLKQVLAAVQKEQELTGISAVQEARGYYIARSNMLNHIQALYAMKTATKLSIGTTATFSDAQEQLEPTTRLLTIVYQNFGDKMKSAREQMHHFANVMAELQTHYSFRNIGEVNYALEYAAPLAKMAGIHFNDMAAGLAMLSRSGLYGSVAGTALGELIQQFGSGGKLMAFTELNRQGGINLQGSLQRLAVYLHGLTPYMRDLMLHQLGFGTESARGVALMLKNMNQYGSVLKNLDHSQGAMLRAYQNRMNSFQGATARLGGAWKTLRENLGFPILGSLTTMVNALSAVVRWLAAVAKAHPMLMKFVGTFILVSAAILAVVGAVAGLAAALTFVVAPLSAIGVGSVAAFGAIAGMISGAVAVIATFGPAVIHGIADIWDAATRAFEGFFHAIVNINWKHIGWEILKFIAEGMTLGAAHLLMKPLTYAAKLIKDHFVGHSPPPLGPLHDIGQANIIGEFATTIRPGPAMDAIRRVARAVALAAPMVIAPAVAPALAYARMTPAPDYTGALRRERPGYHITINSAPVFNLEGAGALTEETLRVLLAEHRKMLLHEVRRALEDEDRLAF